MILGLTGGIGSGKTTVLNIFNTFNIPTYVADVEAKRLMNKQSLKIKIIALLGKQAYNQGKLDRAFVANQVFKNKELLQQLNLLVHPEVYKDFKLFCKQHYKAKYIVYESAILLQSKNSLCDKVLVVTADLEVRLKRVLMRDGLNKEEVLNRINNQWSQSKMLGLADFKIENNGNLKLLENQVQKIHQTLLNIK